MGGGLRALPFPSSVSQLAQVFLGVPVRRQHSARESPAALRDSLSSCAVLIRNFARQ
jgi:hypothetical protein